MAIISQRTLFMWNEVEKLGDLERLKLVIENLPDEELMIKSRVIHEDTPLL